MAETEFGQLHKIAILGGTFNPVHNGHLQMAQTILSFDPAIEQLVFMPNHIPAYKDARAVADGRMRLAMLKLATEGMEKISVSDMELKRCGYTYTVDTLMRIREAYPAISVAFVIGDDSLFQLHTWHEFEKMANLCEIYVVGRDEKQDRIKSYIRSFCDMYPEFHISYVEMEKIPISSSDIRKKLAEGLPVTGLVPEKVMQYIEEQKLYK